MKVYKYKYDNIIYKLVTIGYENDSINTNKEIYFTFK